MGIDRDFLQSQVECKLAVAVVLKRDADALGSGGIFVSASATPRRAFELQADRLGPL